MQIVCYVMCCLPKDFVKILDQDIAKTLLNKVGGHDKVVSQPYELSWPCIQTFGIQRWPIFLCKT